MSALFLALLLSQAADAPVPDSEPPGVTPAVLDNLMMRLARDSNAEGLGQLVLGNYPAALDAFAEAHGIAPDQAEYASNLAFAHHRLGSRAKAEQYYRLSLTLDPRRAVAYLDLADLFLEMNGLERLPEVVELLVRARELVGNDREVIVRQARVASRLGEVAEAERFFFEAHELAGGDDLELEIGDFYRDLGRADEALRWYRSVAPSAEQGGAAAERIRELEVESQARRFGWARAPAAVPERARAFVTRARAHAAAGRWAEAELAVQEALRAAPDFVEARQLLGDMRRERGRVAEAELEYLRALSVEQGSPELHARLAELYLASDRAAEAVVLLDRAVQMAPDRADLLLLAGEAHRKNGDLPRAQASVRRFLDLFPQHPSRHRAAQLATTIERALAGEPAAPETPAPRDEGPLMARLNRARAHLGRGETGAAMAEIQTVAAAEPSPTLRNLEGRILLAAGNPQLAADAFRSSLALDPAQAGVSTELGLALEELGERAAASDAFARGEKLGDPEAAYHAARLQSAPALDAWSLTPTRFTILRAARARLDGFLTSPVRSPYRDVAAALRDRVDAAWHRQVGSSAFLLVALGAALVLLGVRRWGGNTLVGLLREHPDASHEVQRTLAAVRHEVLKHNTMALAGLCEVVERGEPAGDRAGHLERALFHGEGAVARRLDGYTEDLERIGRARGMRLNLRRRDPAVAPLFRGLALLAPLLPKLARGRATRLRARRLRAAADLLNSRGHAAIEQLLAGVRILPVDARLLRDIFERTRGEPALAGVNVGPVELDIRVDLPCAVVIPRPAFEDVMTNLLRNAIQASARHERGEVVVGIAVESEVNAVTGHERLRFAVCDRSPEPLTLSALGRRGAEAGLGLTAELVARYDGSLDVEPGAAGWTKRVVVRLPRGEAVP
jgi:tetratricopeptide (TPR) repeat protein